MEEDGAYALLEPLTFAEPTNNKNHLSFVPWESGHCVCPLCNNVFDLVSQKNILYTHLYTDHKLVVADNHLISSTKGYFDYWRVQFSQFPLTEFCTTMIIRKENYYLLSDILPEDKEIRKVLSNKRLEWVLEYQKRERDDRSFERNCLFCRHVEKSSRYDYLIHLSYHHNFQLGKPNNLVFIDKLIDKLKEKLDKLVCIYCEHVFKDRSVLKEHMRKKFHKRINPKNKEYDPFYVVNYLEGGQQEESDKHDIQDPWSQWREEGSDWSDWQEEPSPIVCLFCTYTCTEWNDILNHMFIEHKFCYNLMLGKFNFYEQVKIVNYIRREIYLCQCHKCRLKFNSRETLLEHMTQLGHFTLPNREDWDHPEFFFPTYENDSFLSLLEDNEEDPVEKLSSQLSNEFSFQTGENSNEIL